MQKKLVAQGNATLTVSLPSVWIKKNNLAKGDEINLEHENNDLVIRTTPKISMEQISLDTKEMAYEKQYLSACYHLGYDEINIHFDNEKVLDLVKERIGQCVGYEIVEQTTEKIQIKSLSAGPLETEFNTILRKTFLVLKDIANQIEELIDAKKFQKLKPLIMVEQNNDKFIDFCLRILNKKGFVDSQKKTNLYYVLVENIELIGDEYKYFCDFMSKNSKKIKWNKELSELLKETNLFFNDLYNIFYKYEKDRQIEIIKTRTELYEKANELFLKQGSYEAKVVHHLINIINLTRETVNVYYEIRF